jgi:polysaccharide biosynthesis transport protein
MQPPMTLPTREIGRLSWDGAADGAVPDTTPQLRALAQVLRARWRFVAAFALGGLVLMAIVTLLADRRWTATAVVQVEPQTPRVTKIDQVVGGSSWLEGLDYFQNQVSLLKSRTLMAAVVRDLKLADHPRFKPADPGLFDRLLLRPVRRLIAGLGAPRETATADAGDATPEPSAPDVPTGLIDRYAAGLEVKPIPNSRLIRVEATARDPRLAQAIANAHANEYIRRGLEAKFELTGSARRYLEQELHRVETELDASEQALDKFRRETHMVAGEEKEGNASLERFQDLARRLTAAETQRIELEAQHQLIEGREFDALPAVLQNSLVQTLKADLARLEAREAELGRLFLDGNPELQQVRAQVQQTRSRLQKEMERAVAGVRAQYLAARTTEQALRDELGRQEAQVLDLRQRGGQYAKLEQAVRANRELHAALLQRMGETDVVRGVQLSNIALLDPAERPTMPTSPQPLLNLAFGLVLGIALGVGVVAVMEHVDTSLRTPADVERVLALPTLGVIPDFRRVNRRERSAPTALPAPSGGGVAAEVFRTLRTSILFFDPEKPPRTMLVTSSRAGEGKTATVVNLALSLAQQGGRVLLIDADLRKPRCHHALGQEETPGLAELLRGEVQVTEVVRAIPLPGRDTSACLDFVPSGRAATESTELVASGRMRAVLDQLAGAYDIVLVDSPPIFPVADASLLATMVEGVVIVVRGDRTPRHLPREAIARLRFVQARILGVVLNGVDPHGGEYASRYAYYFRDAAEA